jgi:hypothetical protein
MSRRWTPIFWLTALASVVLAVWWILTVPYVPRHMYRAIPANATFVSAHRDLAGRWDSFSKNPLTLSLFSSMGVKPSELQNIGKDPESARWMKRLASRDVVLACVPEIGDTGKPVWVFASWLGGNSQRLRWSLLLRRVPGFIRMTPHRGRFCWIVKDSPVRSDELLTITFVEGMLIGCLSSDPSAIHEVLDTYDGLLPALADKADFPSSGPWCADPQAADRGWVNLAGLNPKASFEPGALSYEFTALTPSSVVGQACGEDPFHFSQSATTRVKTSGLEDLFGNLPLAIGLIQSQMVLPLMEERNNPAWLRIFGEVIRDQQAGCIMVAVLGDEFSGRIKGIKVPAILAGIPVANSADTLAWMKQALDRLNAKYRWGLIPRELNANGNALFAIENTASNFYSTLTLEEKPAYTICGEWLLLSSNLASLSNLVERFRQMPSGVQGAQSRETWWKGDLDSVSTPCFARIDLAHGGKTLRLALTTYGLKLLLEDAKGTLGIRQRLNEAKAWIDSLAPLQTCRFWLRSDGQMMQVQFKAGE